MWLRFTDGSERPEIVFAGNHVGRARCMAVDATAVSRATTQCATGRAIDLSRQCRCRTGSVVRPRRSWRRCRGITARTSRTAISRGRTAFNARRRSGQVQRGGHRSRWRGGRGHALRHQFALAATALHSYRPASSRVSAPSRTSCTERPCVCRCQPQNSVPSNSRKSSRAMSLHEVAKNSPAAEAAATCVNHCHIDKSVAYAPTLGTTDVHANFADASGLDRP